MNRLFILAAAVCTLASCAKTQVVYNEEPQEINFRAISNVMTRADGDAMPLDMGVIAYLGETEYFGETCYIEKTGYWGAKNDADKKYWPLDGTLTFTVFAPFDEENSSVNYTNGSKKLEFTVENGTVGSQKDWLYGENQPTGTKETYGNTNLPVTLKHALAKVEINFIAATNNTVTLVGVNLKNTRQTETVTVTYDTPAEVAWTNDGSKTDNMVLLNNGNVSLTTTPQPYYCLVVPTTTLGTEAIEIRYKLAGSNATLTYTVTQSQMVTTTWQNGKKYIYNITIGASEIKIAPEVTPWDTDIDGVPATDDDENISL